MRTRLEYTEGYWWKRKADNLCVRTAYLAEGTSTDEWEQITDAEKDALDMEQEELEDSESLKIITGNE